MSAYWINPEAKEGFVHHENHIFFPVSVGGIVLETDPEKPYGVLAQYGFYRVVPQDTLTLQLPQNTALIPKLPAPSEE